MEKGSWKTVKVWTILFLFVFGFCYLIMIMDVPGNIAALFREDLHTVFRISLRAAAA